MSKYSTEQEDFWAGSFGNEYSQRNTGESLVASNVALFAGILTNTRNVNSVLEFGSSIGLNLIAIRKIIPNAELSAVEINSKAVRQLKKWSGETIKIYEQSVLDFTPDYPRDFVFTKGLLIHINPERLTGLYSKLYQSSARYICIAEYYNPTPSTVSYRQHRNRMFKRDFAGEMLDLYERLEIVKYGFSYHRDPVFPQDDITWFLLRKKD